MPLYPFQIMFLTFFFPLGPHLSPPKDTWTNAYHLTYMVLPLTCGAGTQEKHGQIETDPRQPSRTSRPAGSLSMLLDTNSAGCVSLGRSPGAHVSTGFYWVHRWEWSPQLLKLACIFRRYRYIVFQSGRANAHLIELCV